MDRWSYILTDRYIDNTYILTERLTDEVTNRLTDYINRKV